MSSHKTYTWDEIKQHRSEKDCWVVLHDKVLDVTQFLNEHPGGLDPLNDMAGEDITSSFESIGHSSYALVKSKSFIVGTLDPSCKPPKRVSSTAAPKWSETSKSELRNYKGATKIIPLPAIVAGLLVLLAVLIFLLK